MQPFHTVVAGDTLESIAMGCYRNALAALVLAQINNLKIGEPLTPGAKVRLPPRLVWCGPLGPLLVPLLVFARVRIMVTKVTDHFAPGEQIFDGGDLSRAVAGETCSIDYEIDDPLTAVSAGRLEVVRKADPSHILYLRELTDAERTAGAHCIQWDGRCNQGPANERYIHAVHSPYEVRIVGDTPMGTAVGPAEVKVLIHSLAVKRGQWVDPNAALPAGSDAHYQHRLTILGFHSGPIDGDLGKKSKLAISDFQRRHQGLRVTGTLDRYTKAWLDGVAPKGTGLDHYQFILAYLGYRCGTIDGLTGKNTRRAIERYRSDKGLGPGDRLDAATKAALDGEALPDLAGREVLEGELAVANPYDKDLPAAGAEAKVFIYGDGAVCPGSLPYNRKFKAEQKALVRPHFPVVVRPLLKKSDDAPAFSPAATGPLRIDFHLDTTAPPANLGIPNATSRAYVSARFALDGNQAATGHHAHANRGGVRKNNDTGVLLAGKNFLDYEVRADGVTRHCTCVEKIDSPTRGTAGIYFVPSTIAGDRFALKISVHGASLDAAPAAAIETSTGWLINWRRYQFNKLWFMGYVTRPHRIETAAQLGLPPWYEPAFVDFVVPAANPQPRMITPRNADHRMIDLPLYKALLREAGYRPSTLSDAQITQRFNGNILWPLRPAATYHAANEQAYYDAVDGEITAFEERFATTLRNMSLLEEPGGLTVLVFDENAPRAGTMGIAAIVNPQLQRWSWSLLAATGVVHLIHDQDTKASAVAGGAINGETLAHEVGHALWLHHASTAAGSNPWVGDRPEHNQPQWQACTMSYVSLAVFCGKCVMKLRGFDESKV